jgi:hypothetical protein
MKGNKTGKPVMAKQIERIQHDAQQIASEASSLIVLADPAARSGRTFARKLRQLQARVDRLRRTLWRAQTSDTAELVVFPGEQFASETPSLVDRVLALLDRRCG